MQLCQGLSRCSGRLVRLCTNNKPCLTLSIASGSASVPETSGRQAPSVVLLGSRSIASRAATALRSTLIHQVPSDEDFSRLQSPRVTLVGNLGRDLELRQVNTRRGPTEVASTSLAVTQDDASTLWVKLTFWSDNARAATEMLRKGLKVEVFGVLKQSSYTRKDGNQAMNMEVTVLNVRQVDLKKRPQQGEAQRYKPTMGAGDLYIDEEQEYFDVSEERSPVANRR